MKIETKEDIQKLESAVKRLQKERPQFAIQTITRLVNGNIVEEIKRRMRQANYVEKIIDATLLEVKLVGDRVKFRIFNEYFASSGFDVALMLEKGAKPHPIEGNPLLVFEGRQGTVFTPHVDHPGYKATHIIEDVVNEKTPEVQETYLKEQRIWKNSILNTS